MNKNMRFASTLNYLIITQVPRLNIIGQSWWRVEFLSTRLSLDAKPIIRISLVLVNPFFHCFKTSTLVLSVQHR
jgi:hypothetical protein